MRNPTGSGRIKVKIRKANLQDFPELRRIYAAARQFMRDHGNPNQWGNTSPEEELLLRDLRTGHLYLVTALPEETESLTEGPVPVGAFALFTEPDPTYAVIEAEPSMPDPGEDSGRGPGFWLSDTPYATIHSIGSDGTGHGVLTAALEFAEPLYHHIRIDTHADNYVMQGALQKRGFSRRGIIYLANGAPRIAYERLNCGI